MSRKRIAIGLGLLAALIVMFGMWWGTSPEVQAPQEEEDAAVAEPNAPDFVLADPERRPVSPVARRGESEPAPVAAPKPANLPTPDPFEPFTIHGRVVNEARAPVGDAQLVLYHHDDDWAETDVVVDQTFSDETGAFAFPTLVQFKETIRNRDEPEHFLILATHEDYAITWQEARIADLERWYELTLTDAMSDTITVVDRAGNPIEGARVWLAGSWDRPEPIPGKRERFVLRQSEGVLVELSDADGQVTFKNLPAAKCYFHASKAGYAEGLTFHPTTTIVIVEQAAVTGRVVDAAGKPIPDIEVQFDPFGYGSGDSFRTDREGRYRAAPLRPAGWDMSSWGPGRGLDGRYVVRIAGEAYVAPQRSLFIAPGDVIEDFDFVAEEGVLIVCSVVQAETLEPFPAGGLVVARFEDPLAETGEPSEERGRTFATQFSNRYARGETDSEGLVELRVLPGRARVYLAEPPPGVYLAGEPHNRNLIEVEAVPPATEVTLRVPAVAGRVGTLRGRLTGVDRTESEITIHGMNPDAVTANNGRFITRPAADGWFELEGVPLGRNLYLFVETEDHSAAAFQIVDVPDSIEDGFSLDLELERTYSVEVEFDPAEVTEDSEAQGLIQISDGNVPFFGPPTSSEIVGDDRFRVNGLLPNIEYRVFLFNPLGDGRRVASPTEHRVIIER